MANQYYVDEYRQIHTLRGNRFVKNRGAFYYQPAREATSAKIEAVIAEAERIYAGGAYEPWTHYAVHETRPVWGGGSYAGTALTMGEAFRYVPSANLERLGRKRMQEIERGVADELWQRIQGETGPKERRDIRRTASYYEGYLGTVAVAAERAIGRLDLEELKAEQEELRKEREAAFEQEQAEAEIELEAIRKERFELEKSIEEGEREREAARAEFQAWQSGERRMARLGLRTPYDIVGIAPGVSRPRVSPRRALGAGGEGLGAYNQLRLESRAYLGG